MTDRDFLTGGGGTVDRIQHSLDSEAHFAGRMKDRSFCASIHPVLQFPCEDIGPVRRCDIAWFHVEHGIMQVGIDLCIFPGTSALCSHGGEVHDVIIFDMSGEAGFDLEDRAVFKADLTDGKVFHRVSLVIPVGPGTADKGLFLLVAEIGPDITAGSHRFGRAEEVVRGFEDMHTDIDHGTATLQCFLSEHAPVGNTATAESLTSDKHKITETAFIASLFESFGVGTVAVLEPDREFHIILSGGSDHFFTFRRIHRHGFFHKSVTSGITGIHYGSTMHAVGGTDIDGIRFHLLKHFLPVGEEIFSGNAPGFVHDVETFRLDIHAGDDLHFRDVLVSIQMGLTDPAATDDGDTEFLTGVSRLLFFHFCGNTLCHSSVPSVYFYDFKF